MRYESQWGMNDGPMGRRGPPQSAHDVPWKADTYALRRPRASRFERLAAAASAWLVALGLTLWLAPYVEHAAFVLFWPAVIFTAWYAGAVPALVAAAAGIAAVDYLVVPPLHQWKLATRDDTVTFVVFALVSALVALLTARLTAAYDRAAAHGEALEEQAGLLQQQAVELEAQTDEAQALAGDLERANAALQQSLSDAERARADAERATHDAELANKAKSDFLATMSHELRTPLNAIAGYVELMELGVHGPLTDPQRSALARIQRSQRYLLSLINDVLNFTRLEARAVEFAMRDVAARAILDELEEMITPRLAPKSLTVRRIPVASQVVVHADPERALQILLNLVSNAIKFSPAGSEIVVAVIERDDGRADLEVRDTGPGIPAEKLEAIFEPFVQLDRGLTRTREGVGLGLAISRRLARDMGGDLTVASAAGQGSTFRVTLRQALDDVTAPVSAGLREPSHHHA